MLSYLRRCFQSRLLPYGFVGLALCCLYGGFVVGRGHLAVAALIEPAPRGSDQAPWPAAWPKLHIEQTAPSDQVTRVQILAKGEPTRLLLAMLWLCRQISDLDTRVVEVRDAAGQPIARIADGWLIWHASREREAMPAPRWCPTLQVFWPDMVLGR